MNTMFCGTSLSARTLTSTAPRRVSSRMKSPGASFIRRMSFGDMKATASVLDQIEPEAVAFMSPKDMRRMKLAPGEFIRLETRRGAVEVKVRADSDVPQN